MHRVVLLLIAVFLAMALAIQATAKTSETEMILSEKCPNSPKATREIYVGDHVENLAALPKIELEPISKLMGIPVWISSAKDTLAPKIYSSVFWEVEPNGEYIYYLAGEYKKNDKGLLRFTTAPTVLMVETNFEDDVLSVEQADSAEEQITAESGGLDPESVLGLTINELDSMVPASRHPFDARVVFVPLAAHLPTNAKGVARMIVSKPSNNLGLYVTFKYEEFRAPSAEGEFPRYLKVIAKSSDLSVSIKTLTDQFFELVAEYGDMPYTCVLGATRA